MAQGVAVSAASAGTAGADPDDVGDDLLRLMLIACHPVLSVDARVALTLRLLGGLTTDEGARAFLLPEPTIAQRIVRAKRNEGYAATDGADWMRPGLCDQAVRLGRALAELAPKEPEVHGLAVRRPRTPRTSTSRTGGPAGTEWRDGRRSALLLPSITSAPSCARPPPRHPCGRLGR